MGFDLHGCILLSDPLLRLPTFGSEIQSCQWVFFRYRILICRDPWSDYRGLLPSSFPNGIRRSLRLLYLLLTQTGCLRRFRQRSLCYLVWLALLCDLRSSLLSEKD